MDQIEAQAQDRQDRQSLSDLLGNVSQWNERMGSAPAITGLNEIGSNLGGWVEGLPIRAVNAMNQSPTLQAIEKSLTPAGDYKASPDIPPPVGTPKVVTQSPAIVSSQNMPQATGVITGNPPPAGGYDFGASTTPPLSGPMTPKADLSQMVEMRKAAYPSPPASTQLSTVKPPSSEPWVNRGYLPPIPDGTAQIIAKTTTFTPYKDNMADAMASGDARRIVAAQQGYWVTPGMREMAYGVRGAAIGAGKKEENASPWMLQQARVAEVSKNLAEHQNALALGEQKGKQALELAQHNTTAGEAQVKRSEMLNTRNSINEELATFSDSPNHIFMKAMITNEINTNKDKDPAIYLREVPKARQAATLMDRVDDPKDPLGADITYKASRLAPDNVEFINRIKRELALKNPTQLKLAAVLAFGPENDAKALKYIKDYFKIR